MVLAALAVSLLTLPANAQFGQNHVVVHDFDWKIRSTEHFDIYYYDGSASMVPRAADVAEKAFDRVTKLLHVDVEAAPWASDASRKRTRWERRPLFLYASPNDFEQSNIADVGDGTGGITEPTKNRFMVYNNGEKQWLDEVIPHEFTHIMQYYVLISGFWKSGQILKSIVYPLWWIEGMPDYVTEAAEPAIEESLVRDAATSGTLIPLVHLEHFGHLKPHQVTLGYHEGAEAMQFLADQYGQRKIGDSLRLFVARVEVSQVLLELLGEDIFAFDRRFQEYTKDKYRRVARLERLKEPGYFGGALTRGKGTIPQFNSSPVFSPDGETMYYLTTQKDLDPPYLWRMDMKTGRAHKVPGVPFAPIENIPMGNFANLSRVLSISPDGRFIAFSGTKNHRDIIFLYDVRRAKLGRVELPGFQQINQPSFSPDGRRIVFSGMKDTYTDLYLYDLDSKKTKRLTDDVNDDQMPVFTPDGRAIVYSREAADPLDPADYERRLYRLELSDLSLTRLEDTGYQARDPLISPDGKRVLFVRDGGGFSDVCELDLSTGKAKRLTRTIGGSFTPTYVGDEIAFASLRRGSVHIYAGPREGFLDEDLPETVRDVPGPTKFLLPGMGGVGVSTQTLAISPERPYKFDYSTDLFVPAFFYSSIGGFFWTSYWQGSDMTGNHQNSALLAFHSGRDFQYQATYSYQRYRPQFFAAAQGVGTQDLVDQNTGDSIDDVYNTQYVGVAFPFDRYHRVEASLQSATERVYDTTAGTHYDNEARMAGLALVRDTVRGRYLVATEGDRVRLDWQQATQAVGGNRRFTTESLEAHQFVGTGGQSALAFRGYAAQGFGPDSPQFILGGLGGVRGYGRSLSTDIGSRLAVATAEWRFPIAPDLNYYMWYFFPDFYFKAIFGTIFSDTGYTWGSPGQGADVSWPRLRNSVGLGLRIYTFILQEYPLIVSMDYGQRTTSNGGIFYVYLGELF